VVELLNGKKGVEVDRGAVWVGTGPAGMEAVDPAVVGTATKVTVFVGVTGVTDGADEGAGVALSWAVTGHTVTAAIMVLVTTVVALALAGQ